MFIFSGEQTTPSEQTSTNYKNGRDVGKRLFESGTLKDPRLIYDVRFPLHRNIISTSLF